MDRSKRHRPKKSSEPKKEGVFLVEGLSAVKEYLLHRPELVSLVVYKSRSLLGELEPFQGVLGKKLVLARSYQESGGEFRSGSPVWACVSIRAKDDQDLYASLALGGPGKTVLFLDHITDPRNLGAILRTAAFYGIRHVVVPKDRQVLLTQSSVGTSQGAFALLDLFVVTNLKRVVDDLKKRHFWFLGTSLGGEPLEKVCQIGAKDNLALVLGSEEKGLSKGIEKACDWLVLLEGASDSLQSLNVSVAAGIFCDRIFQIRKKS